MAPGQGPISAAYRAADEARRLEHSWIGPEHVLLSLFAEPSPATEALEELGVTRERVEEAARSLGCSDPPPPPYDPEAGRSPNPAWYLLTGCAKGLAVAGGRQRPAPEDFLLAPGDGGPRRAWVGGEEGIDLEDALATARERAAGS
jgi:hypothetical protein